MDHREREDLKSRAWPIVHDKSKSLDARARALLQVMESHYWRARSGLDGSTLAVQKKVHGKRYCRGYKLDVDVYTRHWMHSNRDIQVDPQVMAYIRDEIGYKPEQSDFLPDGHTSYVVY